MCRPLTVSPMKIIISISILFIAYSILSALSEEENYGYSSTDASQYRNGKAAAMGDGSYKMK